MEVYLETSFYKFILQEISLYPMWDDKSSIEWRSRQISGLVLEDAAKKPTPLDCKLFALFSDLYGVHNSANFLHGKDYTIPDQLEKQGEIKTLRGDDGTIFTIDLTDNSKANLLCAGQEMVEDSVLLRHKPKIMELLKNLYPDGEYPLPSYKYTDVFKEDLSRDRNFPLAYLYVYQKFIFPELLGKL